MCVSLSHTRVTWHKHTQRHDTGLRASHSKTRVSILCVCLCHTLGSLDTSTHTKTWHWGLYTTHITYTHIGGTLYHFVTSMAAQCTCMHPWLHKLHAYHSVAKIKEDFLSLGWPADKVRETGRFLWCHFVHRKAALECCPLQPCTQYIHISLKESTSSAYHLGCLPRWVSLDLGRGKGMKMQAFDNFRQSSDLCRT